MFKQRAWIIGLILVGLCTFGQVFLAFGVTQNKVGRDALINATSVNFQTQNNKQNLSVFKSLEEDLKTQEEECEVNTYFDCGAGANLQTPNWEGLEQSLLCSAEADLQTGTDGKADEKIEFNFNGRVFVYSLNKNKKKSSVFSVDSLINSYNRFGSNEERLQLFKNMLVAGLDKGVALNYIFPNLNIKLKEIEKNIFVKAKDAKLNINSNSEKVFSITPEVIGRQLNYGALYNEISNRFLAGEKLTFNLPIIESEPNLKAEEYKKFTNLRADFATSIASSSADRKHNVKNALASLNRVEVLPGEVFSFNKVVGRRTAENGYRTAKIIVNNEFVDGLGGGVCQVSTTLYNACLLAGLDVVEANKHSKQIGYVKYGFDAMVNFGSSDLKFKNNTNNKIVIITNYSSNSARIRIFGESLGEVSYKLKNDILNVVEPEVEVKVDEDGKYLDKVVYEDESFYLQQAARGMEIKSYRQKLINGKVVSEEFLRHDKFVKQNAIKIVGAKKRELNLLPFL